MKNDALGSRMKHNYEEVSKYRLTRRTPVIIRLDGKSFHTFTKGFKRPFDDILHKAMKNTMLYLCKNIQGCKFGYTQSDEITLLLTDFDTITTDAWFDYEVQKLCSISASMATFAFNRYFADAVNEYFTGCAMDKYQKTMCLARDKGAMFDARCFNIPVDEVANCFIWRIQDCVRNAVQMVAQSEFTPDEIHKKSTDKLIKMLETEKNIKFCQFPAEYKYGVIAFKKKLTYEDGRVKSKWNMAPCPSDITTHRDVIENCLICED